MTKIYYKREDFNFKLLNLQNQFYLDCIGKIDKILETLQRFDGKKITKRIESALAAALGESVYISKEWDWWKLYTYARDDKGQRFYMQDGKPYYIPDSKFYYFDYMEFEDDRLNFEKAREAIIKTKDRFIKRIADQTQVIQKLDALLEERNKLIESMEANQDNLRKLNQAFCGCDYHLNINLK